jgi:hypothetical protein
MTVSSTELSGLMNLGASCVLNATLMNPCVHQDACKVVQMLIDRLETGIAPTVVHDMFGGRTIDTITRVAEECIAHRDELFYTFTLPIAESTNIAEALAQFRATDCSTEPNQYLAESLGGKIDAKKSTSMGHMPRT